jgi:hypothetical protein
VLDAILWNYAFSVCLYFYCQTSKNGCKLYSTEYRIDEAEETSVNGIGLMAIVTLAVGCQLVIAGAVSGNMVSLVLGVPFALAGALGLADDLVLKEWLTKKLLGLE